MVKHTQKICRLLPMNCLSVFDHFVGLVLKGLKQIKPRMRNYGEDMKFFLCFVRRFKGFVRYIFASLFLKSKREHLWNFEKYFLFHFQSSFRSWEIQVLIF